MGVGTSPRCNSNVRYFKYYRIYTMWNNRRHSCKNEIIFKIRNNKWKNKNYAWNNN